MGHRGAPRVAEENTLAAFEAAVAQGAAWVELDVRRSADGVPVLRHDPTVDGRPVAQLEVATLRRAGVSELATVLERLPAHVGVDVELKNLPGEPDFDPDHGLVAAVADVLAASPPRPLLLSSFNPETVQRARAARPDVAGGWLYHAALPLADAAEIAEAHGATVLCPHVDAPLDDGDVAGAHERDLAVLVWTVNEPARVRALADAGVDAVCTDDPAGAMAALGRAG